MLKGKRIGLAILILLTLGTIMPVNVTGPFDARTDAPAAGVRLEYAPAGAVVEPVMAPAQIIILAPDMRTAAISVFVWFIVLIACISAVRQLKRNRRQANWRIIISVLKATCSGLFVFMLYSTFIALVRIPNWRAVADDPDIILAELQTHTYGSHDGLISAGDCLRWHGRRGCRVVAVTEHKSPKGSLKAAALAESDESLPWVLPGVEINLDDVGYIVAIGSREEFLRNDYESRRKPYIHWFHQTYKGVVLALEFGLKSGMIEQVAEAGVDGFSVASDGHPEQSFIHRKEVLAVTDKYNLPTVAWTDWHGIGSILRTWTAIRVPNASSLSREQRAAAVLDALRRHDCSNIVPLTVGRIGRVSTARAIFAPFTECIRYALGLSPARLLAWLVWAVALFCAVRILQHLKIQPGKVMLGTAQAAMGIAVLISCLRFFIAYAYGEAPHFFPVKIGLMALPLGIAAVLFGAIDICIAVNRRKKTCATGEISV
jgi:predicted metal-dependent phosphoesterase TrpH